MDSRTTAVLSGKEQAHLPASGSPCTGCGLCVSVCAHGAITMGENEDGFLTAKVDTTRCIGCKACEKMCARLARVRGHDSHRFYEAWSKDEAQRRTSSSGGVFGELAADCLRRGDVVFGVTMHGTDFPRFIAVERTEDLPQLRGSKYLQADTGDVFAQIARILKEGRAVLFAGLSCQVRAARVRFGERYPNLLLVDLACFGVPSRHLFRNFLAERRDSGTIAHITFRDKTRSWRNYSMRLSHIDGTQTLIHKERNLFMQGFLSHIGLNQCCYTCRSEPDARPGDISLGDFWGRTYQEDEQAGVSTVITHTGRGEHALERIRPALHLEPIDEDSAISRNAGLQSRRDGIPPQRDDFLRALRHQSLPLVLKSFLPPEALSRSEQHRLVHLLRRLKRLLRHLLASC